MTRPVLGLTIVVGTLAMATSSAQQQPPPKAPRAPSAGAPASAPISTAPNAVPAEQGRGGRGGNGGPAVSAANETAGISIDRFIAAPTNSPAHFSHGGLVTRAILRSGDPYKPGDARKRAPRNAAVFSVPRTADRLHRARSNESQQGQRRGLALYRAWSPIPRPSVKPPFAVSRSDDSSPDNQVPCARWTRRVAGQCGA